MNRIVLTGILALASGVSGLMAQQAPAPTPAPAKPPAQPRQPAPKSKGELEALQAMFQAQNPDARIQAAQNLLTKYADTDFKDLANFLIANSYQQKGDAEKQRIFLERTIEVNPKHYQAKVLLAELIAQRTKEFDLHRDEELKLADKNANEAIALLKDAPKPNPGITDEQWAAGKKDLEAQAHQALGLSAMTRKNYDAAITEFKTAIATSSTPEPAFQVRLAQAYLLAGKNDEAIALSDQIMGNDKAHPQIKQVAQSIKAAATQAKASGAKPAAKPAVAPGTVEIQQPK